MKRLCFAALVAVAVLSATSVLAQQAPMTVAQGAVEPKSCTEAYNTVRPKCGFAGRMSQEQCGGLHAAILNTCMTRTGNYEAAMVQYYNLRRE